MDEQEKWSGLLAKAGAVGEDAGEKILFEELLAATKRASVEDVVELLAIISARMESSRHLVRWEVKLHSAISCAAEQGDASTLAPLIAQIWPQVEKNYSVSQCFDQALRIAAHDGWDEGVRLLLNFSSQAHPRSRRSANSEALESAAHRGRLGCVEMLIPVSDPLRSFSQALAMAAEGGQVECAKALLPHSNPRAAECKALKRAAEGGKLATVELLAPLSSDAQRMEALESAAREGMHDCVAHLRDWHMEQNRPGELLRVAICRGLRKAALNGQDSCVAALLPGFKQKDGGIELRDIAMGARARGRLSTAKMVDDFARMAEALAERSLLETEALLTTGATGGPAVGKLRL